MYDMGADGLKHDPAQAASWIRKAAETGDANSESSLAMRYDFGDGVVRDEKQSLAWYRKAADQGDTLAEMSLATRYEIGRGVAKDDAMAFHWNRLLADQDLPDAQKKVATAYALGQGVTQNYVQAYRWLDTAMSAERKMGRGPSDSEAIALDGVAAHLTPAQLGEAKRQVAAWQTSAHDRVAAGFAADKIKAKPAGH